MEIKRAEAAGRVHEVLTSLAPLDKPKPRSHGPARTPYPDPHPLLPAAAIEKEATNNDDVLTRPIHPPSPVSGGDREGGEGCGRERSEGGRSATPQEPPSRDSERERTAQAEAQAQAETEEQIAPTADQVSCALVRARVCSWVLVGARVCSNFATPEDSSTYLPPTPYSLPPPLPPTTHHLPRTTHHTPRPTPPGTRT